MSEEEKTRKEIQFKYGATMDLKLRSGM